MSKGTTGVNILSFILGIGASISAEVIWNISSYIRDEVLDTDVTEYSLSLANQYCSGGRINGIVKQVEATEPYVTDGMAEYTRICSNHDFRHESTDAVFRNVVYQYRKCFNLSLEGDQFVLRLRSGNPEVCKSRISSASAPVYFCLEQPATSEWAADRSMTTPRNCPKRVDDHFATAGAKPSW